MSSAKSHKKERNVNPNDLPNGGLGKNTTSLLQERPKGGKDSSPVMHGDGSRNPIVHPGDTSSKMSKSGINGPSRLSKSASETSLALRKSGTDQQHGGNSVIADAIKQWGDLLVAKASLLQQSERREETISNGPAQTNGSSEQLGDVQECLATSSDALAALLQPLHPSGIQRLDRLEEQVLHQRRKIQKIHSSRTQSKEGTSPTKTPVQSEDQHGEEIARLRGENASLRADLVSRQQQVLTLETKVETLETQVEALADQMAKQGDELGQMRSFVMGQRALADDPVHARLNPGEQMPSMEDRVSALEHKVESSTTAATIGGRSMESLMHDLNEVRKFPERMVVTVGGMVDELRQKTRNQEERIIALEKPEKDPAAMIMPTVEGRLATVRGDVDLSVNRIKEDLQGQIESLQQECKASSMTSADSPDDIEKRFEQVEHMISTLDSQFSNLTTQHVLDAIVAHLNLFCRSPPLLAADIDLLNNKVQALERAMGGVLSNVNSWDANAVTQIKRLRSMVDAVGPGFVEEILDNDHPSQRQSMGSQAITQEVTARTGETSG